MAKIVLIGAGSHTFAKHLITDIVSYPELRGSTITLMDISQEPLDLIAAFAKKLAAQNKYNTKIEATTDRRKALAGADYVFTTIKVGEREPMAMKPPVMVNGVNLSRGDTINAGGVFYGARQLPVILDICKDMEELCPNAWLLNYCNPMAIITWAVNDYTKIKTVGLCHSVQSTAACLTKYMGVPFEEVSFWVAGINHMAWFLELKWKGKDAYPLLREKLQDPAVYSAPEAHWAGPDVVRADVFKAFGYFVTESSRHMGIYVPYFSKNLEMIKKFKLDGDIPGGQRWLKADEELKEKLVSNFVFPTTHSGEYGSTIIHALETGAPLRINANVMNKGLITNLPKGCCVEVPLLADKKGITPCYVGDLPPQLAALNRTNIGVQELAVRGIMEKDKNKIFQAVALDPLTAAMLTLDEIHVLVDEMFKAEKKYVHGYK
jgi:alpha-galactosidase